MTTSHEINLSSLPGGDIVRRGLSDLASRSITVDGLAVLSASTRIASGGVGVPAVDVGGVPSHMLYAKLQEDLPPDDAYSRYNAIMRRMVSFCNALDHETKRR